MEHIPSPKQNTPEKPHYLTLFDVDRRRSALANSSPEQKKLIDSSMLAHTILNTLRSTNPNTNQKQKLDDYKNQYPEIFAEALKMKDLVDAMPLYVPLSQFKHTDIDNLWDWYRKTIDASKFLQKLERETYFTLYHENYLSGNMPKEVQDEFKQFLIKNPSYQEQLDYIREADEHHSLEMENLTTLLGQYHDFSKFTNGEMSKTESNEFIDSILDQNDGSHLLEKLRTMYQEEKNISSSTID